QRAERSASICVERLRATVTPDWQQGRVERTRFYATALRLGAGREFDTRAGYSSTLRSNCALMATTIVLSDISTAPAAGDSTTPIGASTPAASGMATMLYPAAHQRFCTILLY